MTLVIVEWRDIIAYSGWEKASEAPCPTLFSVGWLVSRNQDTIKIANCLDPDDFTGEAKDQDKPVPYGITAFPAGCVVNVTTILDGELKHLAQPQDSR